MLEISLRIIELLLQFLLVIFAGLALLTWKNEIRGKDRYELAKSLLNKIKDFGFVIYSKDGSIHYIYLNDILINRKSFYEEQLYRIGEETAYFDISIWGVLRELNVRTDILLPKKIRILLDELLPQYSKRISEDMNSHTYIHITGAETPNFKVIGDDEGQTSDGIQIINSKTLSIKDYFKTWDKLIYELKKLT